MSVFIDLHCVSPKDSNTLVKTNKEILNAPFFEQVKGLPGNSAILAQVMCQVKNGAASNSLKNLKQCSSRNHKSAGC